MIGNLYVKINFINRFLLFSMSLSVFTLSSFGRAAPVEYQPIQCLKTINLQGKNRLRPPGVRENVPEYRWKQLDPESRFLRSEDLNKAYLSKPLKVKESVGIGEVSIGIVDVTTDEIALAVSTVLSRSIDMARASRGGHIPDRVVDRLWDTPTSPEAVKTKWATHGHRFLITRPAENKPGETEVLGTILVAKDSETIFFLTGVHDNLEPNRNNLGQIESYTDAKGAKISIDEAEALTSYVPSLKELKPRGYFQIVNFAFLPGARGMGLSKLTLKAVMKLIKVQGLDLHNHPLFHSDYPAMGFWQVGEPTWQAPMRAMNFRADPSQHVYMLPKSIEGADQPILNTGELSNRDYNLSWDVLEEYSVALRMLVEQHNGVNIGVVSEDLRLKLAEILNHPIMKMVEKKLFDKPDLAQQIQEDLMATGIKYPERLPKLFELATTRGLPQKLNEGAADYGAKLQYKILQAPFIEVNETLDSINRSGIDIHDPWQG